MEAKELRIGNYVDLYGTMATVRRFDFNDRAPSGLAVDESKPIPITEDWLIKLGFKWSKMYNWWRFKNPYILLNKDFSLKEKPFGIEIKCEYVHELQNLFFALTGIELKIKN